MKSFTPNYATGQFFFDNPVC